MPVHKHLRRLDVVWIEAPIYFLTICTADRRSMLANPEALGVLCAEFEAAPARYGWTVGRFVAMPDHLRFFCVGDQTPGAASLSRFIGSFKQWMAKGILGLTGASPPLWQREFFDHVLRSGEKYESKWQYVRENPVRASLVRSAEDWPYGREIATIMR